jgi:hypothetical protein
MRVKTRAMGVVVGALVLVLMSGPILAQLYWTESVRPNSATITSTSIKRANLDGSDIQTILIQGGDGGKLGGLGLDLVAGKIYSGDDDSLFSVNLDGSGRTVLVPSIEQVADLALDLPHGKLYWSDISNLRSRVWSANLDGSAAALLATFTNALVEGVAVDSAGGKVYFTLNGNSGNDTIQRMNLDGSGRIPCVDLGSINAAPFDVELDLGRSVLYTNLLGNPNGMFKGNLDCSGVAALGPATNPTHNGFHFNQLQDSFYAWGNVATQIDRFAVDGSGRVALVDGQTFGNYIIAVPEPGVMAMSLFALALLGRRGRRRL